MAPPAKKLRAALVGAAGVGADLAAAIGSCHSLELVALADRDGTSAEALAGPVGCRAYTDDRRLLVETRPEVLFVAAPPSAAGDLVGQALRGGSHVWLHPPLGRSLSEAVALCRAASSARRHLAVGALRRYMPGYARALALAGGLGPLYLLRGSCFCDAGPIRSWHGDAADGGGALRELGGPLLDLMTALRGLPTAAAGILAGGHRPEGEGGPVYDSDDMALGLFRFGPKTAAALAVHRAFGPPAETLEIYAAGGSLRATPEGCLCRDRQGAVVEDFQRPFRPGEALSAAVDDFAAALTAGAARCPGSAWQALATVAALEALRLAHRTGGSESPSALLAGFEIKPDQLK